MLAPIPAIVFRVAQEKPPPADSLAAAWPKVHWSVAERGPLLLVEGNSYRYQGQKERAYDPFSHRNGNDDRIGDTVTPLPEPPLRGYNLAQLLPEFGAQVLRYPSLSVITPKKVYVFSPPRTAPDARLVFRWLNPNQDAGGQQEARLLALITSFTASQWAQAETATGLPVASLTPRQRHTLDESLPERLWFTLPAGVERPRWMPTEGSTLLPPTLRQEVHLLLRRSLFGLPSSQLPAGEQELELYTREELDTEAVRDAESGFTRVPNRPRATQLPLNTHALQVQIALRDSETVGSLVKRIGAAAHLSLIADVLIADKLVQSKGTRALAADLLAGLCRALGGTVRRVSEANKVTYFLTDEVQTRGQRNAPQALVQTKLKLELRDLLGGIGISDTLREGGRWLQAQGVMDRLPKRLGAEYPDALWANPEKGLAFEELPPALKADLKAVSEELELRLPKRVKGYAVIDVQLRAPSLNAAASVGTITPFKEVAPLPLLTLPTSLTTRALLTRFPKDSTHLPELLAQVRAFGFTELRIPVRNTPNDVKALEALAEAARNAKLGLVPIVAALDATAPDQPRDRSPSGQTFAQWVASPASALVAKVLGPVAQRFMTQIDFVTPEAADPKALVALIKRLSTIPGVTGIGLAHLAAPGYRDPGGYARPLDRYGVFHEDITSWHASAPSGQRIDFLLKHHVDPDDLGPPEYRDTQEVRQAWSALQAARRDGFLTRLDQALKLEMLPVPLAAQNALNENWGPWTGRYPKGTSGQDCLYTLSYPELHWALRAVLKDDAVSTPWGGIVLDFDPLPLEDALTAVARTLLPRPTKTQ